MVGARCNLSRSHQLKIHGKTYVVRSDVELEIMNRVADRVRSAMQQILEAGAPAGDAGVLAALNLAGELLEKEQTFDEWRTHLVERLEDLEAVAERALDDAVVAGRE